MSVQKILVFTFSLFMGLSTFAYDIEIDGLYYLLDLEKKEAGVTYFSKMGTSKYSGDIIIPEAITYAGETYAVTYVDGYAFYNAKVTSVVLPQTIVSVGGYAFTFSSIESITLSDSIKSISTSCFERCENLKSITLPSNLRRIGVRAFYDCPITSIVFPDSLKEIDDKAFYECTNLESFTFPENLRSIGKYAFYKTAITSLVIPKSVFYIDDYAFSSCSSLETLIFKVEDASTVRYGSFVGEGSFCACNLKTVYVFSASPPPTVNSVSCFNGAYENATLYVPIGSATAYEQAFRYSWRYFDHMVGFDVLAVNNVEAERPIVVGYYNITGTPVDQGYRGLQILQMSDGSTRKIFKK